MHCCNSVSTRRAYDGDYLFWPVLAASQTNAMIPPSADRICDGATFVLPPFQLTGVADLENAPGTVCRKNMTRVLKESSKVGTPMLGFL